jgi:hypothetical protein
VRDALAAMGASLAQLAALVQAEDAAALRDYLAEGATFRRGIER